MLQRVYRWNAPVGQWLARVMPGEHGAAVIDLESGQRCSDLPPFFMAVFSPDGGSLVTVVTDHVEHYDLPSRAAFSPMAWLFLATALALTGTWWYVRRKW